MKPGGPWSVKGIEPQAREAAKTAARRAGKTLGEWLNQVILESGQEDVLSPADLLRNPELWQSEDGSAPWAASIDDVKSRIDASEKRNMALLRQIGNAIEGLTTQLAEKKDAESGQSAKSASDDFVERVLALEEQAQRTLSRDSLAVIEKAVRDVAVVLSASEKRQSERADRIELNLGDLTDRVGKIENHAKDVRDFADGESGALDSSAFAASLAAEMAALRDRVQESEDNATNAFENVHRNISEVVQRLDQGENVAQLIATSEERSATSIQALEQSLERISAQVSEAASQQNGSYGELRATLGAIDERVQSLESVAQSTRVQTEFVAQEKPEPAMTFDREEFERLLHGEKETDGGPKSFGKRGEQASVDSVEGSTSTDNAANCVSDDEVSLPSAPTENAASGELAFASDWEIVEDEPSRSPVEVVQDLLNRPISAFQNWRTNRLPSKVIDDTEAPDVTESVSVEEDGAAAGTSEEPPLVNEEQEGPTERSSEVENRPEATEGETQDNAETSFNDSGFTINATAVASSDTDESELPKSEDRDGDESGGGGGGGGGGDDDDDDDGGSQPSLSAKLKKIQNTLISQTPEEEESFRGSLRELVSRDEEESNKRPYYLASGALVLAVAAILTVVLSSDNSVQLEADGNRPTFVENVRGLLFGAPEVSDAQVVDGGDELSASLDDELAGRFDEDGLGTLTELSKTSGNVNEDTTGLPGAFHSADFDVTAGLMDQAEDGDVKAQFALARAYATGQGFTADQQSALRWYRAAAGQELAVAQYLLGSHYERGLGVARDGEAAVDWYAKAAAGGNARAMHNLAVAYAQGHHVEQDLQLGVHWFQEAAELGLTDAQFNLGLMLERGLGVAADKVQAFKWYAVAALNGDEGATRRVEQISKEVSESDLRFVDLFVETWRPRAQDPIANGLFDTSPMAFTDQTRRAQIAHVQDMLDRLGYNIAATDGIVDPTTTAAIKEYQNLSLMPASGEITLSLVDRLESAVP